MAQDNNSTSVKKGSKKEVLRLPIDDNNPGIMSTMSHKLDLRNMPLLIGPLFQVWNLYLVSCYEFTPIWLVNGTQHGSQVRSKETTKRLAVIFGLLRFNLVGASPSACRCVSCARNVGSAGHRGSPRVSSGRANAEGHSASPWRRSASTRSADRARRLRRSCGAWNTSSGTSWRRSSLRPVRGGSGWK